jgi:hypothetical protein
MTIDKDKEVDYKLLCEKVLNESWSEVSQYAEEIQVALNKENPDENDILLINIAARAFLQRVFFERAESVVLFDMDLYKN